MDKLTCARTNRRLLSTKGDDCLMVVQIRLWVRGRGWLEGSVNPWQVRWAGKSREIFLSGKEYGLTLSRVIHQALRSDGYEHGGLVQCVLSPLGCTGIRTAAVPFQLQNHRFPALAMGADLPPRCVLHRKNCTQHLLGEEKGRARAIAKLSFPRNRRASGRNARV